MKSLGELREELREPEVEEDEDLAQFRAHVGAWVRHVEDSVVEVELLPAPTTMEEDLTNALALLERVDTMFSFINVKEMRQLLDPVMSKEAENVSNEITLFLQDWITR